MNLTSVLKEFDKEFYGHIIMEDTALRNWIHQVIRQKVTNLIKQLEMKKMQWPKPTPDMICIADGYNQAISEINQRIRKLLE